MLHNVLLRWKSGGSDGITKTLRETGFGMSDVFYRVAQAIAESLSNDDNEKKLLEGFLAGKERMAKEAIGRRPLKRGFSNEVISHSRDSSCRYT